MKIGKKVEVRSNGILIGYTSDEGKTIDFLDCDEAKRIIESMNKRPVSFSVRQRGYIGQNCKIVIDGTESIEVVNTDTNTCPECGYPKSKKHHEDFERCHGCDWTSK